MTDVKNGIKHGDLIGEGATFNIDFEKLKLEEEEARNAEEVEVEEMYYNTCDLLMPDEDLYNGVDSFESIATKMTKITENGDLMKLILRPGCGEIIGKDVEVRIDYNAYFEYNVQPFDSTYARKKPHHFTINSGTVIEGLDLAVQTMKINEKAQFLIKPSLAYGKYGCCGRIPPNSTVLFEVELKKSISVASNEIPTEKLNSFEFIYQHCRSLHSEGNQLHERKQYSTAIKKYNRAANKLESCILTDYSEQEKQQKLLIKLYSNIVICYTKLEKPRQGCHYANIAINVGHGTIVPAKVYYFKAKCLRMLGDYEQAEYFLKIAHKKSPASTEIADEFKLLEKLKDDTLKKQAEFAAACMKDYGGISVNFKNTIIKVCEDVKKENTIETVIHKELSDTQKSFIKNEVEKHGLNFRTVNNNGVIKNIIEKIKPAEENHDDEW